jgi:dGTPase
MTPEELHRLAVLHRVETALNEGHTDFNRILPQCEGADPALVAECIKQVGGRRDTATSTTASVHVRELFVRLPAPDPSRSQWWFTGETVDQLAKTAIGSANGGPVLCLGTPTIGHELISFGVGALVLDVDHHVVNAVRSLSKEPIAETYDVADSMAPELEASFRVAVVDPPWYDDVFRAFLGRALWALSEDGELFCTLPPRLTRPGIETFRRELVSELIATGHEVLGLEIGRIAYVVPRFEEVALKRLAEFRSIPWRRADLLHMKKHAGARGITIPRVDKLAIETYARSPHEFRVFVGGRQSLDNGVVLERLDAYSTNISTRAYAGESPDIWTTEKVGARLGQLDAVKRILSIWQDVGVRSTAEAIVRATAHMSPDVARNVVGELDRALGLWSSFASVPPLRTDDEIETAKKGSLTAWATGASPREHPDPSDLFRGKYQRDRDRVLWSHSLRRLAHKTQLFPTDHDDQLRQRLAHSIEVMQLASTIGSSFGLDRDLIEAGALAHDIGHTPFGHAGEHALNRLLGEVDAKIGGFNHYEHGVDVVRWLEGPYAVSRTTAFHGLNLTPEVAECILKHTYCQVGNELSAETLHKASKHSAFIPGGYCHLEGQAVRAADKISYFVSDLEDGIRLGAITSPDLLSCRFFHRAPLNFSVTSDQTLSQRFIEQRRNVLKILMEDVLVATNKRLARMKPQDVRGASEYTVNHSDEILRDMNEVWERLQRARLHEDRRVKLANLQAARIVSDLTIVFAVCPQLVEPGFSAEHSRLRTTDYISQYRARAGAYVSIQPGLIDFLSLEHMIDFKHEPGRPIKVAVEELVQAKDFVAGFTDSRARTQHSELFRV